MKKYIPVLTLIVIAMAAIPAAVNKNIFEGYLNRTDLPVSANVVSGSSDYTPPDEISFTDLSSGETVTRSAKSVMYSLVGAAADKDFTADEIKALSIAYHTQLCIESDNGTAAIDTKDSSIFLSESELKNKFGSSYTTLCSYCDNVYDTLLILDGKLCPSYALPICTEEYGNKVPVADPYDALYSIDSTGNTYGITPTAAKLMSQQGNTYEEILNYFCVL